MVDVRRDNEVLDALMIRPDAACDVATRWDGHCRSTLWTPGRSPRPAARHPSL
jgi:hypothetical protein